MLNVKHWSRFGKTTSTQPDPVISRLRPDRHFGSISEHMNRLIDNYMSANPDKVSMYIFLLVLASLATHTHTRLTALFPGLPRWAGTRKVKPIANSHKRMSTIICIMTCQNHTSSIIIIIIVA